MAFLVEDGTGLAAATAYVSVATVDAYHTDRNHTAWTGTDAVKQAAIIRASSYVDKRFASRFRGYMRTTSQAMEWPRNNAQDQAGRVLPDLPPKLLAAVCEYALRALIYGVLTPDVPPPVPTQTLAAGESRSATTTGGEVTRTTKTVGPITKSVSYGSAASRVTASRNASKSSLISDWAIPEYPEADLLLEPLLQSSMAGSLSRG